MPDNAQLPETILQFGTGRFLRCFVDLFVDEINRTGAPAGRIVVVQSMGVETAAMFRRAKGRFHAAIRGLVEGTPVDQIMEVRSVGRAIAAAVEWPAALQTVVSPSVRAVVSNVTEAGYALDPADEANTVPPRSFPAKLLTLLAERYRAGLPGVAILPCELLDGNAHRLLSLVTEQANRWRWPAGLVDWLEGACSWHDTLVDRIVSAPTAGDPLGQSDPLFAVAEPYAFWGIAGRPSFSELTAHPAVRAVADLAPYVLRKVRILNGAHTALVAKALPLGFVTVRQAMANAQVNLWIRSVLFDEIVPVLENRTDAPADFARVVLDRFANPFLDHRLADIAMHHETKLKTRVVPTITEFRAKFGRSPRLLSEVVL